MKQIKVSDQVHERLMEIKKSNGHTSLDSVIRQLLSEARRSGEA
jgi:predicted CopG family antitoxin